MIRRRWRRDPVRVAAAVQAAVIAVAWVIVDFAGWPEFVLAAVALVAIVAGAELVARAVVGPAVLERIARGEIAVELEEDA